VFLWFSKMQLTVWETLCIVKVVRPASKIYVSDFPICPESNLPGCRGICRLLNNAVKVQESFSFFLSLEENRKQSQIATAA